MAIERDPARVATGGLAGLLGSTFSPIPPTPTDEQRRVTSQAPAAPSGQIVNVPSFKPTGVTQLPSPLLIRPETVSRRYFRGSPEGAFGPRSRLDEVLDRIGQIIKEQVDQSKAGEVTSETTQATGPISGEQPPQSVTTPFEGELPSPPVFELGTPPTPGETTPPPPILPPTVFPAPVPPTPVEETAPTPPTPIEQVAREIREELGLPPIPTETQPFVPPPPPTPPPPQYPQTEGRAGEGPAAESEPSGPSTSGPEPSGPSPTGPALPDLTFEALFGDWDRDWFGGWDRWG